MNICFISPPTLGEFNDRFVADSEALRLVFEHAPMGILSLAAVLDQQAVQVQIVDLNRLYHSYVNTGLRKDGIEFCTFAAREFESISADVFGFSTICSSYPLTLRLARMVRDTHPEALIALGGPQASVVAKPTLEAFPFVDFIVRGEAEETLPRVLDACLHRQKHFGLIAGITYRRGGDVVQNPNAPVIEDLDQLPLPGFHLYPHANDCSYIPLEAGRGCPFACSFCSTNDFFRRRFRMKSAELLVEQMKTIKARYKVDSFDLIHDMFTVDRKRVVAFCEALEKSGEELYWGCSARTDCMDDDLIDLMAQHGCNGIFYGVDSGSDRVQALIHKRLDLDEAAARIKRTNARGIAHTVSMITGFPEETKDDLRGTIRFIGNSLRHEHAQIQLHLLAPLAETPITSEYQDRLVYDDIFSDISFQGWEQDKEERAMIANYRNLFPNFYAVPTRWVDRNYLREVREFILHAMGKVRWLLVLLNRDSGDLLSVFDRWVTWSAAARKVGNTVDTSRKYYSGDQFIRDLARFVESDYLTTARYPHLVKTLVDVEAKDYSFAAAGNVRKAVILDGLDCVPRLALEARMLVASADYKKLMRSLKRKERIDSIPTEQVPLALLRKNGAVRVLRLNNPTYRLMTLCDGSRNISQIAAAFAETSQLRISPLKASVYGLASLARQGLIDVGAGQN
jgi:radical SAM superfamily enzyme YgiQ (UPF0313 family)